MFFDHLPATGFICGHRGARSIAPENTLLALEKARDFGAHAWETDVRVSREGEPIIFHDDTLERTTDVAGHSHFRDNHPWPTERFTVAELRELDAGSWFLEADPFGTVASGEVKAEEKDRIRNQKIPLLGEILSLTARHRFPVNLELKDLGTPPGDTKVVDRVLAMLEETGTMDLVLLSSFRHEYLRRAQRLCPSLALGVLVEKKHPPDLIHYLKDLSAAAYHPSVQLLDLELVQELRRVGVRVNSWTVNDMTRAGELLQAGVGVITDWPQHLTGTTVCRRYP
ncbi:glycerophosphodiester phosphodiesterase [Desulfolithobacter sp.]